MPESHDEKVVVQCTTNSVSDWEAAKSLLASSDAALILVKGGKELLREFGKGVLPLLRVVSNTSPELLCGAALADRVLGKAAAFLALKAKFAAVYTPLMSEPAKELLEGYHIAAYYDKLVPNILRQDLKGLCPMEQLVREAQDAEQAYGLLLKFFSEKGTSIRG